MIGSGTVQEDRGVKVPARADAQKGGVTPGV
jgi:hypothetical protein